MRLILVFLMFASFAHADIRADMGRPTKIPFALNWKPEPQFGGFYAAKVKGYDKQAKIDLDIQPGGAGTPVVQMVAAGKFDFGIASADEVIIARSHGADVVALFAAYQTNPQAIMTHDERGFKNLGEVYAAKGTLAIQKGLPYALYLQKRFPKSAEQIVPYLGGIQNFLADKNYSQQCFATSEPLAAEKKGAKVKTFLVADAGYNPYTTVVITRGEVLKKNESLVRSLVATVRSGWQEYLDHPEATNEMMGKLNTSVDAETFASGARAQKPLIQAATLGQMTETRWTELRQQLVDLGLVSKDVLKTDIHDSFRSW